MYSFTIFRELHHGFTRVDFCILLVCILLVDMFKKNIL